MEMQLQSRDQSLRRVSAVRGWGESEHPSYSLNSEGMGRGASLILLKQWVSGLELGKEL